MLDSIYLQMEDIPCYSQGVNLNNLKKVNLFYGLNGSGKSTLARYFQDPLNPKYSQCSASKNLQEFEILVFNEKFVSESVATEKMNSITKIEINKNASEIFKTRNELSQLEAQIDELTENQNDSSRNSLQSLKNNITSETRATADRIAEARNWFNDTHLMSLYRNIILVGYLRDNPKFLGSLLEYKPDIFDSPEGVKPAIFKKLEEHQSLSDGLQAPRKINYQPLTPLTLENELQQEGFTLLSCSIVNSKDSYLANIIHKLNHQSWVELGIRDYLPNTENCPFCDRELGELKEKISSHLDGSYNSSLNALQAYVSAYENWLRNLEGICQLNEECFVGNESIKQSLLDKAKLNFTKLKEKISYPSEICRLEALTELIEECNRLIQQKKLANEEFNSKLENRDAAKEQIKKEIWSLIATDYKEVLQNHRDRIAELDNQYKKIETRVQALKGEKDKLNQKLIALTEDSKDLEGAIININNHLKEMGYEGFYCGSTEDGHYFIARDNNETLGNYDTLSAGEKTMIAFLYFLEKCQDSSVEKPKIIVIDDPISSLSFDSVFDVASLIKTTFYEKTNNKTDLKSDYIQLFILTHHIVFYDELCKAGICNRNSNYSIFRISKVRNKTSIQGVEKDSVQNHYEMLWEVLKEAKAGFETARSSTGVALLANCMRQILETFFSLYNKNSKPWSEKFDLIPNYSYKRYIQKLSHSDRWNMSSDIYEMNLETFFNVFKEIFEKNGHIDHYNIMMGEDSSNTQGSTNTGVLTAV